jgi:hypothetical protein
MGVAKGVAPDRNRELIGPHKSIGRDHNEARANLQSKRTRAFSS